MKKSNELSQNARRKNYKEPGKEKSAEKSTSIKVLPEFTRWLYDTLLTFVALVMTAMTFSDNKMTIAFTLIIISLVILILLILKKKWLFRILIILAMLCCVLFSNKTQGGESEANLSTQSEQNTDIPGWEQIQNAEPGETVPFGNYWKVSEEKGKEEITWIVLAKENGKLLLLSKEGLDCQQFNKSDDPCTWESSYIQRWLNNDFLNNAFSSQEQEKILTAIAPEYENSYAISVDTEDKVGHKIFLLSVSEVKTYFQSEEDAMAYPTKFALSNNAGFDKDAEGGPGWWWLRTPGGDTGRAADVKSDGSINYNGNKVNSLTFSVRPALWLDVDS